MDKIVQSSKEAEPGRTEERRSGRAQSEYDPLSTERKRVIIRMPISPEELGGNRSADSPTIPAKLDNVRSEEISTPRSMELPLEKSAASLQGPTDETTKQSGPTQPNSTQFEDGSPSSTKGSVLEKSAALRKEPARDQNATLPSAPAQSDKPPLSLLKEVVFVTLICSAQLLTQAGLGQAISPLHIIAGTFGSPAPGQLSWFAAGYSLTIGTFILVAGRLGDMFGHKLLFTCGYFWYALWSLVAGFSAYSQSQVFFDFCRAMQGIGPAVLLPSGLAILGTTYPPGRRKDMIFSMFGATAPGGFVLGAAFSGLIAERAWWPWAYWCMGIVCTICAVGVMFFIPSPSNDMDSQRDKQSFDYLGAVTGVTGLVLFNVAWNQAPTAGWSTPYVIVFLILGILFLSMFLIIERRVSQPLLPMDGLPGTVGFVLGCIALGWASFGIWVYYLWQFLEVVKGDTPLSASAQQTPTAVSGLCAALTTGFILSRIKTEYIMVMAMTFFCVGNVLLATCPIDQSYWLQTFFSTIITPWGMDMSFPAATIILSNLVPKRHQGIAASLVNTIVNYSISIGLGIAGTVDSHVNSGGSNIVEGYRGAWYAAIGLAGCGILLSLYFVFHGHNSDKREKNRRTSPV